MRTSSIITIAIALAAGVAAGRLTAPKNPQVVVNNETHDRTLTDWEIMQLAIIKTESEFDPLAVGKTDDYGIYQITPVYVKEVNRILGEEKYFHEDAFSPAKSVAMFDIMQNSRNPEHDIERAISGHNPTATAAYSVKVHRNMDVIRQYEQIRNLIR